MSRQPHQNAPKPTLAAKTEQRVVAWAGRHLHVMLLARNASREFLGYHGVLAGYETQPGERNACFWLGFCSEKSRGGTIQLSIEVEVFEGNNVVSFWCLNDAESCRYS